MKIVSENIPRHRNNNKIFNKIVYWKKNCKKYGMREKLNNVTFSN